MSKKLILIVLMIITLNSCNSSDIDQNNEYTDDGNEVIENIEDDIGKLAENTFNKGKDTLNKIDIPKLSNDKKIKSDNKKELIKNIETLKDNDEKAKWIYDNFYKLPDIHSYLVGNDPDTIEFIYNYNNSITDFKYSIGESENLNRATPFYLQWDNRWAYDKLSDTNVGFAGCGPTSMAMILSRLLNDKTITPRVIAKDAQNYMIDEGISWNFFNDEALKYNLKCFDINNDKQAMIDALKDGPLLVSVNKGYFTLYGHIFVIDSYKNGKFIINDPNSIKNSKVSWTYEEIQGQIAHIWKIK